MDSTSRTPIWAVGSVESLCGAAMLTGAGDVIPVYNHTSEIMLVVTDVGAGFGLCHGV
jgi:hypothetical protein